MKISLKQKIELYLWFIKESQSFCYGTENPLIIFFKSLYLGIGFVKDMVAYYE